MKFDTTQVNFFNGCITIPIPKHLGSALQALIAAVSKGKVLQVQIYHKTQTTFPGCECVPVGVVGRNGQGSVYRQGRALSSDA